MGRRHFSWCFPDLFWAPGDHQAVGLSTQVNEARPRQGPHRAALGAPDQSPQVQTEGLRQPPWCTMV